MIQRSEVKGIIEEMFNSFDDEVDNLDVLIDSALKGIGKFHLAEFTMDDMVEVLNWINGVRNNEVKQ